MATTGEPCWPSTPTGTAQLPKGQALNLFALIDNALVTPETGLIKGVTRRDLPDQHLGGIMPVAYRRHRGTAGFLH
jgi:hypothetical protein